jgi:hypothetical protein
MGPRLRGDDKGKLLTALQLQRAAGHDHLNMIVVDLAQRIIDSAAADLPGAELINEPILRGSCRAH